MKLLYWLLGWCDHQFTLPMTLFHSMRGYVCTFRTCAKCGHEVAFDPESWTDTSWEKSRRQCFANQFRRNYEAETLWAENVEVERINGWIN